MSKHPEIYSSFKIDIHESDKELALDEKNWPANAHVKRFFTTKENKRLAMKSKLTISCKYLNILFSNV